MAQNSKIEWTTHSANLWHGCVSVHSGCDNCYAETLSKRWGNDVWGNDKPRKEVKSVWNDLAKYQKLAKEAGAIHKVFVGSMMDIFEKPMPIIDSKGNRIIDDGVTLGDTGQLRDKLFHQIDEGKYPNLLFLLLTKRPSNINKMISHKWKENPPCNVMFGTSPVDQTTFDKLVGQLLEVNGKKFLSVEPQLGDISLRWGMWHDYKNNKHATQVIHEGKLRTSHDQFDGVKEISWIIQGGESGHHKRPFDLKWAYKMKEQCAEAGIPYFFKQIDKIKPIPEDLMIRQFPEINL